MLALCAVLRPAPAHPTDTGTDRSSQTVFSHIPLKIAVHYRKEDLEEKVDGVDEHRQQKKPGFSRHCA